MDQMNDTDQDEQTAKNACRKALISFRDGGSAESVIDAFDTLIMVRMAILLEEAADRVEAKAAKDADHADG